MIQVLHGDNLVKSRQFLTEKIEIAREKDRELVILDGLKTSLEEIRSALGSKSLFGSKRLVIIENLYSSPQSKRKSKILGFLKKGEFETELILWEKKEIKKRFSKNFKVNLFKLSTAIFKFLESLKPKNKKESLRLLNEVKRKESEEMIFYLLIRQIRLLIKAKDLGEKGLTELQSWQKRKLLTQAKNFKLDQLKNIYQDLLKLDYQQKTSGLPLSLSSSLDLLIASI